MTPFELLYGVEPCLNLKASGENDEDFSFEDDLNIRFCEVGEMLRTRRIQAVQSIQKAQEKQKEKYDNKRKEITYKKGDLVLKKNYYRTTRQGAKTEDLWHGPYKIIDATPTGTYYLAKLNGQKLMKVFNGASLKMYEEDKKVDNQSVIAIE